MSSEKLQDLFYMVLMAGNFLNSVSMYNCGINYDAKGCEDFFAVFGGIGILYSASFDVHLHRSSRIAMLYVM